MFVLFPWYRVVLVVEICLVPSALLDVSYRVIYIMVSYIYSSVICDLVCFYYNFTTVVCSVHMPITVCLSIMEGRSSFCFSSCDFFIISQLKVFYAFPYLTQMIEVGSHRVSVNTNVLPAQTHLDHFEYKLL